MPRNLLLMCCTGNKNSINQHTNKNKQLKKPKDGQKVSYDSGLRHRSRSQPSTSVSNKKVQYQESFMEIQSYASSPMRHIREAKIIYNIQSNKRKLINNTEALSVTENETYFSCDEEI